MKNYLSFLFVILLGVQSLTLVAEAQNVKYWVQFKDKLNNSYDINQPEPFLSERALDRRTRFGIAIDSTDLPVSDTYISSVTALGVDFVVASKWLNGITIQTNNASIISDILALPYVIDVDTTWYDPSSSLAPKSAHLKFGVESETIEEMDGSINLDYGYGETQIQLHNGNLMHDLGFRGEGMLIAVIDNGFQNAPSMPSFTQLYANGQVKGTRDFVDPGGSVYMNHSDYAHGTSVLSCMAGYDPGLLIGTAIDADYWLIRTEETANEQPVEMDYWVAGAELADSVGADLINSSLGYYAFDNPHKSYTWDDMDGKTTRCSQAASLAATKGMLVVTSSGNEGNIAYGKLVAPSDGIGTVGVGSVNSDSTYTYFSSRGYSADGRVKPNMCAMGYRSFVQVPSGSYGYKNGTSFSSPILCGLLAILWQSLPNYSAQEIIELAQLHSSQFSSPDMYLGYGIPNIYEAYQSVIPVNSEFAEAGEINVYPNPSEGFFTIVFPTDSGGPINLELVNLSGQVVYQSNSAFLQHLPVTVPFKPDAGLYVLNVTEGQNKFTRLVSFQ